MRKEPTPTDYTSAHFPVEIESEHDESSYIVEDELPVRGKRTISQSTNDENSFDLEYGSSSTPTRVKKLKPNEILSSKLVETIDVFKNHLIKINAPTVPAEETANSTFMKSATLILSSLKPISQIKARRDIMQYLCDIQLKDLEE